ncbi:hypothetical protein CAL26_09310 [Bordetella genomosp. 9]|uniref:Uncharacterized protein n=1 Tax=Bordetella genomosp. 9 TaxID=1416803 RepID=A0A261RF30_9BORD|nr:hypothetical protein [Bordetella genomosp. 9]OZI23629.1 hypothetical protein CAL26_09310 [Bordetella genomosp. 9]
MSILDTIKIATAGTSGIWAAAGGAALVGGLVVGGWWLHHSGYESGKAACEAAHTLADLQQFKVETGRLSDISTQLAVQIDSLASATPTVIKEYHETVVKAPLPAGCVIDPGRLRSIQDAIAKAAVSGQRGSAVSPGSGIR